MNNRNIIKVLSAISTGIVIVLILYAYSISQINHKGSFIRLFPPHVLNNFKYLNLVYDSYYLAGITDRNIYLGNYTAPAKVLVISKDFSTRHQIDLTIADSIKLNWSRAKVIVSDEIIYIGEGNSPAMLYSSLQEGRMNTTIMDTLHFDHDWVPMSTQSFVVRKYDSGQKQNILVKKQNGRPIIITSNGILEKQIDGKFCTDGTLLFDSPHSRLLYIYYYRNQFIVMDTNLNIISKFKTIDTTNKASISLDTIYSENRVTFASPPRIVNKRASVSNNLLFINSNLRASNEDEELGKQDTDIDIYNIVNGNYEFSFSLPAFRKQKLSSMIVSGKMIYGIFNNYLISYELNLQKL